MSECVQVIDEAQTFNPAVPGYVSAQVPSHSSYNVVAVFGSQSTGKLTLLNRLFNTSFSVMDDSVRLQTTKGIWMAKLPGIATTTVAEDTKGTPIFVLDVEGSDGRERADDQDFERKAALFALATTEVLIINLWEHQVGLYHGANMGLLRTVFEVNQTLFGGSSGSSEDETDQPTSRSHHKLLLLVVIRDHVGLTPKENLQDTISTDLKAMFAASSSASASVTFDDFFDIAFHFLPHKILQPSEFDAGVKLLGDQFPSFFRPEYRHHTVPVHGWPMYANQCWDQIVANKDLDLPTQQVLVAQFKCDEASQEALTYYQRQVSRLAQENAPLPTADLKMLGSGLRELEGAALSRYDESAGRYHESTFKSHREQLLGATTDEINRIVFDHAQYLVTQSETSLKKDITEQEGNADYTNKVHSLVEAANEKYRQQIDMLTSLPDAKLFSTFDGVISRVVKEQRNLALAKMVKAAVKRARNHARRIIAKNLSLPSATMWEHIVDEFTKVLEASNSSRGADFDLGVDVDSAAKASATLNFRAWDAFVDTAHSQVSPKAAVELVRERFEDAFRYDSNGVPRLYSNATDLESTFQSATLSALESLDWISEAKTVGTDSALKIPVNVHDQELRAEFIDAADGSGLLVAGVGTDDDDREGDPSERPTFPHLLTEAQISLVRSKVRKEWAARYIETKRLIVSLATKIPVWFYVALVVLGWNEFLAILRSPILFSLVAMMAAAAFALQATGLLGPVMAVAATTARDVVRRISEQAEQLGNLNLERVRQGHIKSTCLQPNYPLETVEMDSLDKDGRRKQSS